MLFGDMFIVLATPLRAFAMILALMGHLPATAEEVAQGLEPVDQAGSSPQADVAGFVSLPIPAGGIQRISVGIESYVIRKGEVPVDFQIITVPGAPFATAVRFENKIQPKTPYDIGVRVPAVGAIREGEVGLLRFWARGPFSEDESGAARISANVELNQPPYRKVASSTLWLSPEWRQFNIPFKAGMALSSFQVALHLGFYPQVVELAGVELLTFPPDITLGTLPRMKFTYEGREPDAQWRKLALERILDIRRSPLHIEVVDGNGAAVSDATVEVKLERHLFGFGAAVVGRLLNQDNENGRLYREIVEKNFNKVVFENDLKWQPWVRSAGSDEFFRRKWVDDGFKWLAERDIPVRGHYLSWGPLSENHRRTYANDPEGFRQLLYAHLEDKVPTVGSRVAEWDVLNHPVGWGLTIDRLFGSWDIYGDIITKARELAPGIPMWINEGQILPGQGDRIKEYEALIQFLVDKGKAPDGIAFMGHFSVSTLTPPEVLLERFDRFAKIIPNLQITEFDVGAEGDEILQADYYRDVLIAAFSHPAMSGVVMWGFWEGRHWFPERALWRKNWEIKPAGQAWIDLVHGAWNTRETVVTDASGAASVIGFDGAYTVRVTKQGRTVEQTARLEPEGSKVIIVLAN